MLESFQQNETISIPNNNKTHLIRRKYSKNQKKITTKEYFQSKIVEQKSITSIRVGLREIEREIERCAGKMISYKHQPYL